MLLSLVGSDIIWLGFCTNEICMVGIVELNTPGVVDVEGGCSVALVVAYLHCLAVD
jgi:hypothetical protein